MTSIGWKNLRSLNGSQQSAFEELCCQLAAYEIPADATPIRKGTPDAGVEYFAILPDGSEWGWQAKYFLSMGQSQWAQLDDSVKTALAKHPRLTVYTICIPLDRADPRIDNQKWFLDEWNEHVEKWKKWAAHEGRQVEFKYWGSHELLERLSREEHRGRYFFWFGEERFSQKWFTDRLQEAIEAAGPRYTPEIDVRLPIAQLFDGLGRSFDFFTRVKVQLREIKKAHSWVHLQNLGPEVETAASALQENAQRLFSSVLAIDKSPVDPIPWELVASHAVQTLQAAQNCLGRLSEAEKAREANRNRESTTNGENRQFESTRHHIYKFMREVEGLQQFIQGAEAHLSNVPALLLSGEAGKGKTHLFCDIAKRRVEAGLPTVLLMGQWFTQEEPWTQIIRLLHLKQDTTVDEFLGALEAAAQACGAKALILIDALNEGEGKKIWKNYIAAVLQSISRYPWIGVATSVRSSFEHVVIPEELIDTKLIRAVHYGFAEHEYQAMQTFFDFYGIEYSSVPLLVPEFQTPLFLKILCKGLKDAGVSRIPTGLHGITAIFKLFVDAINEKLSDEAYLDYHPKRPIVWHAIDRIAEAMANGQKDWLLLEEAEEIANQVLPAHGYGKSLFNYLLSEGILAENGLWIDGDQWREVIHFAYEKFSDHLIVKHLLDRHLDVNAPEKIFSPGQPLAFLTEKRWGNEGLIEALCIQLPERIGKELPEIVPTVADYESVCQGFIESLVWRDPKAITDSTLRFLNKYADQSRHTSDQVLNALLTVATNPDHPYNADFLHAHLMRFEMAERDAWWSIFLHQQYEYEMHDAVDRLVDWAWSPEKKDHIADESIRLCGVALAWFLTTSHRFLRDRTTKALVNLFTDRIHVLQVLMQQFLDVNDPYVLERLLAVAYGCTLRSVNDDAIGALAQAVYDWVFRNGKPPVHILSRDYARGVIEYALHRGIELDVEVDRIKPPYQSEWPPDIPEQEDIEQYGKWWEGMPDEEWGRETIHSSVMGFGDFARYVIGTDYGIPKWLSLRLDEPPWRSAEERREEFVASLTARQRKKWEEYQLIRQQHKEQFQLTIQSVLADLSNEQLQTLIEFLDTEEHDSEAPQAIERLEANSGAVEAAEREISLAEHEFRRTLGNRKRQVFETQVLPYLDRFASREDAPQFDLSLAQRWILKRVFDIGWTVERFGRFDRHISYHDYREARKAERIGKKYQWIAYHEFLARLADNFQFREPYSSHPLKNRYVGTWQINVRDLDPSCILKATGRGDGWRLHPPTWWFPRKYTSWDFPSDDVKWMNEVADLPDIRSLIEVVNLQDGSHWLTLDGLYTWKQSAPPEEESFDIIRREIWYILRGYLVHQSDIDELFTWAIEQNFMGDWMPKTHELYKVFLGEFFWSPAYNYHNDPYERTVGWQYDEPNGRVPKPIMPLADGYMQEDRGFDCSIDEGISISLPNQLIVETMGLRWNGVEGSYFDKIGKLIAFDPSVRDEGPSVLLIEREAFLSFLQENDYAVLWTVLGEKQLIGGGIDHQDWKGTMELSGAYRVHDGKLEGKITPRFRSPTDKWEVE